MMPTYMTSLLKEPETEVRFSWLIVFDNLARRSIEEMGIEASA